MANKNSETEEQKEKRLKIEVNRTQRTSETPSFRTMYICRSSGKIEKSKQWRKYLKNK